MNQVHFVKIQQSDGTEEMFIKADAVKLLIDDFQRELDSFPRARNRSEMLAGGASMLDQVIVHLKELLPK